MSPGAKLAPAWLVLALLPADAPAAVATIEPPPQFSPRIANYTIEARLRPQSKRLEAKLLLEWHNKTDTPLSEFPFHLYWNAFKNNLSQAARGEGREQIGAWSREERARRYGYQRIRAIRLLGAGAPVDLLPTLTYLQPDIPNPHDQTVFQVRTPEPIAPGATLRLEIEWDARIPHGAGPRSGWVHDDYFLAQWFPKIGVHWRGQWNCHTFHASGEFFADFGVYLVRLTTPARYLVGASGRLQNQHANSDGSITREFYQEDVHDFAWTASPNYRLHRSRFRERGLRPVEISLLTQPEHEHWVGRYLQATRQALRWYGRWYGEYPYAQITVVDPVYGSGAGGMEYPTLLTGGTSIWAPVLLHNPESVTIHEVGHQFWYGLVANNEFEEAWLDEGLNTYSTAKVLARAYPPAAWGDRWFAIPGVLGRTGIPWVAPRTEIGILQSRIPLLRRESSHDRMASRSWEFRDRSSYGLNAYGKPALVFLTLERMVGEPLMQRILRTYAHRFRFGHPTTEDFIALVEELSGADWSWFFDQTFYSSELCDYAVAEVRNRPRRRLEGYRDRDGGAPVLALPEPPAADAGPYASELLIERKGGVRMPVEVRVEFSDGSTRLERWDGQDRWRRFEYDGPAKIQAAVVDPARRVAIDVDPSNNSWSEHAGVGRRAALKWALRWMLWFQDLLELYTV